jgi:hypothetical protein
MKLITAAAPTATGTIRTTGTTISDFVAPGLDLAGNPAKAGVLFFMEKGIVQILVQPGSCFEGFNAFEQIINRLPWVGRATEGLGEAIFKGVFV